MHDSVMTFGEIFAAIRQGDVGVIVAFGLECLIMVVPFVLVGLAIWH